MEVFRIKGPVKLKGEITPQGAKNEALQILSAVLLTPGVVNINNLPDIEDIQYFKSGGKEKSNNDCLNKIRENVITNIFNIDSEYTDDTIYGADWKNIQEKKLFL